jgi:hypothetical protein
MQPISYARHRFPPDIIRRAVWLYLRFTRDVEIECWQGFNRREAARAFVLRTIRPVKQGPGTMTIGAWKLLAKNHIARRHRKEALAATASRALAADVAKPPEPTPEQPPVGFYGLLAQQGRHRDD